MKNDAMKTDVLNKKFFSALLFLVLAGALSLTFSRAALAQDMSSELKVDHRMVQIREREGLVPNTVIIKPGTTVIWLNYCRDAMVIKFENQKVTTACRQPINFFVADNGAYQSHDIKTGAVASLCFIEKGTFEYQLKKLPTDFRLDPKLMHGVIKVQ